MLNSSGESGQPCFVPDFRGNAFSFSPLRIMFAVGLSYMAFIMLRYVPSMPAFWRVFFFYHKWMLNFVKGLLSVFILKGIRLLLCQLKRSHSCVGCQINLEFLR